MQEHDPCRRHVYNLSKKIKVTGIRLVYTSSNTVVDEFEAYAKPFRQVIAD